MSTPIADRVRELAAETFDQPLDAVQLSTTPNDLDTWDSLAQLNLIVALEDEFGIELDPEHAATATSIASLVALVTAARV